MTAGEKNRKRRGFPPRCVEFSGAAIKLTEVKVKESRSRGCAAADYRDLRSKSSSDWEHMTPGVIMLRAFLQLCMKS